jgi:D-alanine-D-alanine ligase
VNETVASHGQGDGQRARAAETRATEPHGTASPMPAARRLLAGLDRLRERLVIAVLYNGDAKAPGAVIHATYNPRSDKSYRPVAEDIAASLGANGFRRVIVLADDMRLGARLAAEGVDIAWINSAGVQGYGAAGHTPAMLELFGLPYVGHNPLNAATLDNKHAFKRALLSLGIPTAPFVVWDGTTGRFDPDTNAQFARVFAGAAGPFVVKPVSGRASLHVHLVETRAGLAAALDAVYRATSNLVMIESFLPGAEYAVSVMGGTVSAGGRVAFDDAPFVLSPVERRFERGERIFTSMDVRPITRDRSRLLDPAADGGLHDALASLARQIYREFQLRTLIRLDVRADAAGRLHVLEANPKPDLARPSGDRVNLVAVGLGRHGMSYDDLILSLLLDRLHFYLARREATVRHIAEKLEGAA